MWDFGILCLHFFSISRFTCAVDRGASTSTRISIIYPSQFDKKYKRQWEKILIHKITSTIRGGDVKSESSNEKNRGNMFPSFWKKNRSSAQSAQPALKEEALLTMPASKTETAKINNENRNTGDVGTMSARRKDDVVDERESRGHNHGDDVSSSRKKYSNIDDEKDHEHAIPANPSPTSPTKRTIAPGFPIANYNSATTGASTTISLLSFLRPLREYVTAHRLWTATQIGIGYWLCVVIWRELRDGFEDILEEEKSRSGGGVGLREEHDLPFLSSASVDLLYTNSDLEQKNSEDVVDDKNSTTRSCSDHLRSHKNTPAPSQPSNNGSTNTARRSPRLNRKIQKETACAEELASRLQNAGLSLEEQKTLLKSLTRAEGLLLTNSLLTPDSHVYPINSNQDKTTNNINTEDQNLSIWNDIGGLNHIKEALLDLMFHILRYSGDKSTGGNTKNEQNYGGLLSHPPGLLLYGPPGCGKTMLARALAHSSHARFLCVTPSTLLRKYIGETNINVRALFSLAQKLQPTVIFVDEMDGLFRERGGSGGEEHDVFRDLKTEFMQQWDGISSASANSAVIVIGATNRPFDVDSAFLRRMPRSFLVGLPDYHSRTSILQAMLRNVPLSPDFSLEVVARETDGYSGSDIKELLRVAAMFPLREARLSMLQSDDDEDDDGRLPPLRSLTTQDILWAKNRVQPTQWSKSYSSALAEYAGRSNPQEFASRSNSHHHYDDSNSFTQPPISNEIDPFDTGYSNNLNGEEHTYTDDTSSSLSDDDDDDFL